MRTRRRSLTELDVFLAIARQGGLRPAATALGVSVSSVSDRLRELEERIGARLFHRSTRSLALTENGAALLKNLEPAMGAVDAALDSVGRTPHEPAGKLRINAAPPAADLVLGQMLGGFLQRYPFISVELCVDDGLVDIVEGGFDAGIRYEENLAADMIAVQLGRPQRYALVAAPTLLAQYGRPDGPVDLANIPAIRHQFPSGALLAWEFERDGTVTRIDPQDRLICNHAQIEVAAAIDGAGALLTFEDYVAQAIADGRLVRLLSEWLPPFAAPCLYYFSGRQVPPPLRAFIDHARDWTQAASYGSIGLPNAQHRSAS
jgi:DNA-binding transcriptional LysR family regulator